MEKIKLLEILNTHPITTSRTKIQPMTDTDLNEFLSHTSGSLSVIGTELEESFKEKCKGLLSSETEIVISIRLKGNNTYIGYFELKNLNGEPEIGIEIIEDCQKQGFGFEVCRAVIDFIFNNTEVEVLKYNCFRNNTASLKLAEKLGAERICEKILFDKLPKEGLSQETIDESAGFDLIVHEIRK